MRKSIHVILICLIIAIFFTGCKNFEPIIIPGQPDECNDFYSVMQYYSVEGKDSAFLGTVYNECKLARQARYKQRIEDLCGKLYTNKDDYAKCLKNWYLSKFHFILRFDSPLKRRVFLLTFFKKINFFAWQNDNNIIL